jgi:hypothetical protein
VPISATGTAGCQLRAAASLVPEIAGGLSAAGHILRGVVLGTGSAASGTLRSGEVAEPVILVHGLGANSSCFRNMERHLHSQGYTVYAVNYSCLGADIAECGRQLEREAAWLREETGSESANVVAHSLGGVVLRWAMAHTWMRDWVEVAVTLGSPHHGTPSARLAPAGLPGFGKLIGQLRPTSVALDRNPLHPRGGRATRWVCVAAEHDWVVPAKCAQLPPSPQVHNVTVPWCGHLTLPNSSLCWQIILTELAAAARRKHDAAAA